jgi:hypothetical protein
MRVSSIVVVDIQGYLRLFLQYPSQTFSKELRMKVLPLSDIHLDFYFLNANKRQFKRYCESVLHINEPNIDVITVAGDLGHYNADNKAFLIYLAETYEAEILFTYGNHCLYFTSPKQLTKYKGQSMDRIRDMKGWASNQEHIHFLDGTYIDIQGKRFGGMCNWYDGSYYQLGPILANYNWKKSFNDYYCIYKNGERYVNFLDIRDELDADAKIQALVDADCNYIFTHVCPLIDNDIIELKYQDDPYTAFYFSNNSEVLDTPSLQYLQFGHTHNSLYKQYGKILAFNAAVGYPHESKNFNPRYIDM